MRQICCDLEGCMVTANEDQFESGTGSWITIEPPRTLSFADRTGPLHFCSWAHLATFASEHSRTGIPR